MGVVPNAECTINTIPIAKKYRPKIKTKYLLIKLSFSISLYETIYLHAKVLFFSGKTDKTFRVCGIKKSGTRTLFYLIKCPQLANPFELQTQ